ncbi:MAG TPA: SDR family NAD(P)-dependent oxidoreductase, partial [Caulobacteraceae bacterium]|nr:SDR family NAD(P)-dependent oxidoreductase [Caulobacteraceae bacterium]
PDVAGFKADVSLKPDLQAAAEATLARFGAVHVLVNNAGVGGGGRYGGTQATGGGWSDAGWEWLLGVNLMSVVWGVELFGPLIEQAGGGHIVSTASMAGLVSQSSNPYSVSKYGVVALMEGLRVELSPKRIGVSVLCPGLVATRIIDAARNLPARLSAAARTEPLDAATAAGLAEFRRLLAAGADPDFVGELVREGIEGDWPYIFTDTSFERAVEARFARIREGFDRVRGLSAQR